MNLFNLKYLNDYTYKRVILYTLILLLIGILFIIMVLYNFSYFKYLFEEIRVTLMVLIPILVLIWFLIFNIMRLKIWKIDINICNSNDALIKSLQWTIDLYINKQIKEWNLNIYLRWYSLKNGPKWSMWIKRYENQINLEENKFFGDNFFKSYNFNFSKLHWNTELLYYNSVDIWWNNYFKEGEFHKKQEWGYINLGFISLWKIEVKLEKKWINLFNIKKIKS